MSLEPTSKERKEIGREMDRLRDIITNLSERIASLGDTIMPIRNTLAGEPKGADGSPCTTDLGSVIEAQVVRLINLDISIEGIIKSCQL